MIHINNIASPTLRSLVISIHLYYLQHIFKWYCRKRPSIKNIYVITLIYIILQYSFLKIRFFRLNPLEASKFDLFQKFQTPKSSFLNIFQNSFRNELQWPFLPYFDTQHSICEIFTFLLFGWRGLKNLKLFFMISKNNYKTKFRKEKGSSAWPQ